MEEKRCIHCRQVKLLNDFYIDSNRKDGHCGYCKQCSKELGKIYSSMHREQYRIRSREHSRKTKIEVLTHYGNGKCACVKCGESRLACLSLDHINGGGTQHYKARHSRGNFYYSLKKPIIPRVIKRCV